MPHIDQLARAAAGDQAQREELLGDYTPFILSCASKTAGRRITRSDEEWSLALYAFSQAIDSYDEEKGSFLSYARLLISRRLIDSQRAQYRSREVAMDPQALTQQAESNVMYQVTQVQPEPDQDLREELFAVNDILADYGFSFFDLAGHTPRKSRSRGECSQAVTTLTHEPPLMKWMRQRRHLPLNRLCQLCEARKKTLSLFRHFVITAAEVLTRDFPSLRGYFRHFLREVQK